MALFSALRLIDMVLARFGGVVARVRGMPMSRVCMVRRSYVISGLTLVRRFAMMPCRMLMMFGGAVMVLGGWVFVVHLILSKLAKPEP